MIITAHNCCYFPSWCTCVHWPGVGHQNRVCTQCVQCRVYTECTGVQTVWRARGWSDGPTVSPPIHAGNCGALRVCHKVMIIVMMTVMSVMLVIQSDERLLSDPCYSRCVTTLYSQSPLPSPSGRTGSIYWHRLTLTRQHPPPHR